MVKKTDPRIGRERVHELAVALNDSVQWPGFISDADNVTVTLPRDLLIRLRNSFELLDYGMNADDALDLKRGKGRPTHSHLEVLRRRALAIQYAIEISERDDLHTVIAEEIGMSPLANIGRDDEKGYSVSAIEKMHSEVKVPWTELDPDFQMTLRKFIDLTLQNLEDYYGK